MRVKSVSEKTIKAVARYYISDDYISLEKCAEEFGFSRGDFVSNLLFRGVSENIIDDRTTDILVNKIIYVKDIGVFQRRIRWEKALALREETKNKEKEELEEEKKSDIEAQKELLKFQIETYDDYFYDDENAPSKEELIDRLNRLS